VFLVITAESADSSKVYSTVDGRKNNDLRQRHLWGHACGVGVAKATDTQTVGIEVRDIDIGFLVEESIDGS
jgi:hypothetical protein